jgi:DNA-binding GntR family transcriptional regulator
MTGSGRAATTSKPAQGSKAEVAYERIRSQIIDGTFGPGYRLILDRLATEIGVSAVPVREALRRLEAEGYVDFKRNLGATVCRVDAESYAQTMQTLAILEASATAMAAPHITKKDIKAALKINDAMTVSLDRLDPVTFSKRNHELHETLYLPCPNAYLLTMVEREWTRLRGIRQSSFAFVPDRARQAVAEHVKLIELIDQQASPAKIEDYARAHRMRTARRFLDHYHAEQVNRADEPW